MCIRDRGQVGGGSVPTQMLKSRVVAIVPAAVSVMELEKRLRACPVPVQSLALPDSEIVTGSQRQVYHYYSLDAEGICRAARKMVTP